MPTSDLSPSGSRKASGGRGPAASGRRSRLGGPGRTEPAARLTSAGWPAGPREHRRPQHPLALGFYFYPPMGEDLIDQFSPSAHCLLGISIGYFVQDFLDMICNQKLQKCWELLFHHFVVIVCFGFAFLVRRFVGFAMVALLVEINSVFLHLRTILRMAGLANTTSFRLASLINLGTYLVFRILILAWMSRWLALNQDNVPAVPYAMGTVGMAIMLSINIVLFYRLLRSDFLPSHKE
ncbi:TLC domain-containing protein 2 isoform X1 [Pantherophis guttatus]|uniref:TLC domain-containing protein 2 isoform X1 n=1 Tax=Pantherophis guttatus TaxID=94885 RepID=A0A6P9CC45_PANGU|nr:TLC domain-containing protein 2 isoform X1 [Pantherophis guttatus]